MLRAARRSEPELRTPEAIESHVQHSLRWNMGAGIIDHISTLFSGTLQGVYVPFAPTGAALAAETISGTSVLLEFAPEADRPSYIGLSNTLRSPFRLLAPKIGGTLAGLLAYGVLFAVAAVASLLGVGLMSVGVREPRAMPASRTSE